jgi:inner membrane protein
MDSITQIALGVSVLGAITGHRLGRKAIYIGAVVATIPDLDVFIPYGDAVANFTYHRGFSHSLIFAVLMTYPLCWLLSRFKAIPYKAHDWRWLLAIFLTLHTHALLDAMTIYGTQLFWPSMIPPAGVGSVFIIDPLYTLPLLIGMFAFSYKPTKPVIFKAALCVSSLYLIWSVALQYKIINDVRAQIAPSQNQKILVQPAPFNTLLWRILIVENDGYKVAYTSIFDKDKTLSFKDYASDKSLLAPIRNTFAVQRLEWFTKGYYSVTEDVGTIYVTDLRMGMEPDDYVFSFAVGGRNAKDEIVEIPNYIVQQERDTSRLSKIWRRIWDQTQQL